MQAEKRAAPGGGGGARGGQSGSVAASRGPAPPLPARRAIPSRPQRTRRRRSLADPSGRPGHQPPIGGGCHVGTDQIGRGAGRERGEISGVAGSLKKKKEEIQDNRVNSR